jgi:hypothetical protein
MIKRCIYCGRFFTPKDKEKSCKECAIEYNIVFGKLNKPKERAWKPLWLVTVY